MSDAQRPRRSNAAPAPRAPRRRRRASTAPSSSTSSPLSHERHAGDAAAFRRAAIEALQAALASGRSEARKALEEGGTGRACAEALSAEIDDLLRVVLEMSARWLAPAPPRPKAADHRRGRRLRARHAGALFGHRPPVPAARQAVARRREDRRGAALCAVGPQAEGRPCDAHDRRMPEAGARRHDDPHHADRGAVHHRRPGAVRDAENPLRQGDRRQDGAPSSSPRSSPSATRACRRAGASRYLVEPNVKEGKGGLARPQHAVLDLQIRLSRPQRPRARRGRAVLAARIRALSPLRGIPLERALPAAFSRRPGGGAPELRRPAADRPSARLFDPRRADRRRAVHEALFPRSPRTSAI